MIDELILQLNCFNLEYRFYTEKVIQSTGCRFCTGLSKWLINSEPYPIPFYSKQR